jgi:hypothetical protein
VHKDAEPHLVSFCEGCSVAFGLRFRYPAHVGTPNVFLTGGRNPLTVLPGLQYPHFHQVRRAARGGRARIAEHAAPPLPPSAREQSNRRDIPFYETSEVTDTSVMAAGVPWKLLRVRFNVLTKITEGMGDIAEMAGAEGDDDAPQEFFTVRVALVWPNLGKALVSQERIRVMTKAPTASSHKHIHMNGLPTYSNVFHHTLTDAAAAVAAAAAVVASLRSAGSGLGGPKPTVIVHEKDEPEQLYLDDEPLPCFQPQVVLDALREASTLPAVALQPTAAAGAVGLTPSSPASPFAPGWLTGTGTPLGASTHVRGIPRAPGRAAAGGGGGGGGASVPMMWSKRPRSAMASPHSLASKGRAAPAPAPGTAAAPPGSRAALARQGRGALAAGRAHVTSAAAAAAAAPRAVAGVTASSTSVAASVVTPPHVARAMPVTSQLAVGDVTLGSEIVVPVSSQAAAVPFAYSTAAATAAAAAALLPMPQPASGWFGLRAGSALSTVGGDATDGGGDTFGAVSGLRTGSAAHPLPEDEAAQAPAPLARGGAGAWHPWSHAGMLTRGQRSPVLTACALEDDDEDEDSGAGLLTVRTAPPPTAKRARREMSHTDSDGPSSHVGSAATSTASRSSFTVECVEEGSNEEVAMPPPVFLGSYTSAAAVPLGLSSGRLASASHTLPALLAATSAGPDLRTGSYPGASLGASAQSVEMLLRGITAAAPPPHQPWWTVGSGLVAGEEDEDGLGGVPVDALVSGSVAARRFAAAVPAGGHVTPQEASREQAGSPGLFSL